jgi:hypothetical protein
MGKQLSLRVTEDRSRQAFLVGLASQQDGERPAPVG